MRATRADLLARLGALVVRVDEASTSEKLLEATLTNALRIEGADEVAGIRLVRGQAVADKDGR